MRTILFGPGYCGTRIRDLFATRGITVMAAGRMEIARPITLSGIDLIVSTVPPAEGRDPVLAGHEAAIRASGARLVYLSSTGVYGDSGGGWVDEGTPLAGRRPDRIAADRAWLALGAIVLRLPGIYGPGRSVVDRLREGKAVRVDLPGQVFSRIHVEDVARAVLAATRHGPTGAYNIADDLPCAQADIVAWAAARLGLPEPPLQPLEAAGLSPAALAFYGENRRVANGKAARLLGWRPLYRDYRAGLRALIASARPSSTSTPPAIDVAVQR